jgi:hypothetical protein
MTGRYLPGDSSTWPGAHNTLVADDPQMFNATSLPVTTGWMRAVCTTYVHDHALTVQGAAKLPPHLPASGKFDALWMATTVQMLGTPQTRLASWSIGTGSVGIEPHAAKRYQEDPGRYARLARQVAAELISVSSQVSSLLPKRLREGFEPMLSAAARDANVVLQVLAQPANRRDTYGRVGPLLVALWAIQGILLFHATRPSITPSMNLTNLVQTLQRLNDRFMVRLSYPDSAPNSYSLQLLWRWQDPVAATGLWSTHIGTAAADGDLEPVGGTRPATSQGPAQVMCSLRLGRSYQHATKPRRGQILTTALYLLGRPLMTTVFSAYGAAPALSVPRLGADCELLVDVTQAGNATLSVK